MTNSCVYATSVSYMDIFLLSTRAWSEYKWIRVPRLTHMCIFAMTNRYVYSTRVSDTHVLCCAQICFCCPHMHAPNEPICVLWLTHTSRCAIANRCVYMRVQRKCVGHGHLSIVDTRMLPIQGQRWTIYPYPPHVLQPHQLQPRQNATGHFIERCCSVLQCVAAYCSVL